MFHSIDDHFALFSSKSDIFCKALQEILLFVLLSFIAGNSSCLFEIDHEKKTFWKEVVKLRYLLAMFFMQ